MTRICPMDMNDCMKEKCAWWLECGNCAIPAIAKAFLVQSGLFEPEMLPPEDKA